MITYELSLEQSSKLFVQWQEYIKHEDYISLLWFLREKYAVTLDMTALNTKSRLSMTFDTQKDLTVFLLKL